MKRYYSLAISEEQKEADIYIFGDIVDPLEKEYFGVASDVSGYSLAQDVKDLDVETINVHINSYGGAVSEGLAIYNTLRQHKAKIKTLCDGFACSAASVVFMAGDERIVNSASLLMIHNAWTYTAGNADQLRKDADDLETITQAAVNAYMECVNIPEDEIKAMMKDETWILPAAALEMGFATSIMTRADTNKAAASASKALFSLISKALEKENAGRSPQKDPEMKVPDPGDPVPAKETENKPLKMLNAIFGGKEQE
jgi:ATP-dependent Clp protease protease subunit